MSYSIVGHCPKCGAPIYVPLIWHGITPPPNSFSCSCNPQATLITTSGTAGLELAHFKKLKTGVRDSDTERDED